jgi:hypothetical protein
MALPEHLERLKQISIDTLGLSENTEAILKFYGFTDFLDCIRFFFEMTLYTYAEIIDTWPRHVILLFDEVKPKLIAAGYWDLVLDADMQRTLDEYKWHISHQKRAQRVAHWQGRDQNLYEIPFEHLGLSDPPFEVRRRMKSIGNCIDHFLYLLNDDSSYWLEVGKGADRTANRPLDFEEYMLGVAQPRLMELGYWAFVEKHVDDFMAEGLSWWEFGWGDGENDG